MQSRQRRKGAFYNSLNLLTSIVFEKRGRNCQKDNCTTVDAKQGPAGSKCSVSKTRQAGGNVQHNQGPSTKIAPGFLSADRGESGSSSYLELVACINCEASEHRPWRKKIRTPSAVHPVACGPPWLARRAAVSSDENPATARITKITRVSTGRLSSHFRTLSRFGPASIVSSSSVEIPAADRSSSSMHVEAGSGSTGASRHRGSLCISSSIAAEQRALRLLCRATFASPPQPE